MRAYFELAKPGIVRMVLVTTAVGYAAAHAASGGVASPFLTLLWCVLGTALACAGANGLNQAIEWKLDAQMERTRARPVPSGRLSPRHAGVASGFAALLGAIVLGLFVNVSAAGIAVVTTLLYVLAYTPAKTRTTFSTLIGTLPGALPALIGWVGASPDHVAAMWQLGGWSIVLIVVAWQMPHFMAIGWKYREQYRDAGYLILPVVDERGTRTAACALRWSLVLVPLTLLPVLFVGAPVGVLYGLSSTLLSVLLLVFALRLMSDRSALAAKNLFLASIAYLPLVLGALVIDALLV
ncbi:MAG: heme o synthase [Planctomycetota bacterium]